MLKTIRTEVLKGIGNAIRTRSGVSTLYRPAEMASAIRDIPNDPPHFKQYLEIVGSSVVPHVEAGTIAQATVIPVLVISTT